MQGCGEPDETHFIGTNETHFIGTNEMLDGIENCKKWKPHDFIDVHVLYNTDLMKSGEQAVPPDSEVNTCNFNNDVPNVSSNVVYPVSADQRELINSPENELGNPVEDMEVNPAYLPRKGLIKQPCEVDQEIQHMNTEEVAHLEQVARPVNPQEYTNTEEVAHLEQVARPVNPQEYTNTEEVAHLEQVARPVNPQEYTNTEEVAHLEQVARPVNPQEYTNTEEVAHLEQVARPVNPQEYTNTEEVAHLEQVARPVNPQEYTNTEEVAHLEQVARPVNPQEHEDCQSSQVSLLHLPKPPTRYNTATYHVDTATAGRRKRDAGACSAAQKMSPGQKHRKIIKDYLNTAPRVIEEYTKMDLFLDGAIEEMRNVTELLRDLLPRGGGTALPASELGPPPWRPASSLQSLPSNLFPPASSPLSSPRHPPTAS